MPLYVYACQICGDTLERMQSFSALPLTECEKCGGELRRVLQPAGIIFRGNGFYTTDYGRASSGKDSSHESSTEAKDTSPASSSSESTSSSDKSSSDKKEASGGVSAPVVSTVSST